MTIPFSKNQNLTHFHESQPFLIRFQNEIPKPRVKQLWVEGENFSLLERLPEDGLAVVGTRFPDLKARKEVVRILSSLKNTNTVIVSGLAEGIDGIAHEVALSHHLPTIAIIGSGMNQLYPKKHSYLKSQIVASGGLILSEYPPDQQPFRYQFIGRNRLIACFSKATWVVQAPEKSGALSTADFARECGRDVYATPSFPEEFGFLGNQKLIEEENAIPLFGAHSLGHTWKYFSSLGKHSNVQKQLSRFEQEVERREKEGKILEPASLFEWAQKNSIEEEEMHRVLMRVMS